MILADTSVWVDHFRRGNSRLAAQVADGAIAAHEFIIGELAAGNLRSRSRTLADLAQLPHVAVVDHYEVLTMVESHKLHGRGLSWIDLHLLAAASVSGSRLWTLDERLSTAATDLRLV